MNKAQGHCPSLIITNNYISNILIMQKNTIFFFILLTAAGFIAYNIYGGLWLAILSAVLGVATLGVIISDLFRRKEK